MDKVKHWENIYISKSLEEVSWYQPNPTTSIDFLEYFAIPTTAKIIDVGGGDSFFADRLLDLGYTDITVLDISASSLERAKKRLGEKAAMVKWIVADAATFIPTEKYDFWHDRAAFHFLTEQADVAHYVETLHESLTPNGYLVIGTFSENGPKKCSGIEIKQYSENSMTELLNKWFQKIKCILVDHQTPFDTIQNFIFCSFKLNT